jgi:peptide/nickel transport system ATP-binding protein
VTPPTDSATARVTEHLGVSRTHPDELLLVLDDLRTHFRTDRGLVRAVDGVSLTLKRGESLGVVGESGSGKTVLSR